MASDANLILQASTTVTATGTSIGISLRNPSDTTHTNEGGTPPRGLVARIIRTAGSGTTPSVTYKIQVSDDNATWFDKTTGEAQSAAGEEFLRWSTKKPWVRLAWTVTGTTPSFTFQADVTLASPA